MIFLRVTLDNMFMFKGAKIDLTYPRKLNSPTVEDEWVEGFPNINFKRVCVLSGANASGKTAFGKALCMINNYISGRSIKQDNSWFDITKTIFDKSAPISFEVEFITPETRKAHSLFVKFDQDGLMEECYRYVDLRVDEAQSGLYKRLHKAECHSYYHRDSDNHEITNAGFSSVAALQGKMKVNTGWNYRFCKMDISSERKDNINANDTEIIKAFLAAFDSSIIEVESLGQDSYRIVFSNGEHALIDKGKMADPERISRGTHEAIEVAMFYGSMKSGKLADSATFYLDEMLAYSHTEAEQSILNLLIDTLPRNSQLFYSTHNYDILDMNLPAHSYVFLKKEEYSDFVQPELLGYNKNDRNLLGYVKNDVFGTLPNMDAINNL